MEIAHCTDSGNDGIDLVLFEDLDEGVDIGVIGGNEGGSDGFLLFLVDLEDSRGKCRTEAMHKSSDIPNEPGSRADISLQRQELQQ